jgi:hypothetical protein
MPVRRFLLFASLAAALTAGVADPASSAASSCHPAAHVLARQGGVVIWSVLSHRHGRTRDRVVVCKPTTGGGRVVFSSAGNVHPHVSQLQVAGHFVGFVLGHNYSFPFRGTVATFRARDLYVFDAALRRVTLTQQVFCNDFSAICGGSPQFDHFLLASNGWIAGLYDPQSFGNPSDTGALLAGDATHTVPLDFGLSITGVSLAGDNLTWTSDNSGASSVTLGPGLIPAAMPQMLGICQLLTNADVAAVMGSTTSSSVPGQCTYTGATQTLTVSLGTGLTPDQVRAAESALDDSTPSYGLDSWGNGEGKFDFFTRSITGHEQVDGFEGGAQLALDLSAPGAHADEQLTWLASVAMQRLFAVPVSRAQ